MEAFIDAMQEYSGELFEKPKTWMEAFRILKTFLKKKVALKQRCIVFFDELPSMDTQRSGFVRALGYFWNSWASLQDNLTLIVCGSATSWMIRHIVDDKGGLHDCITHEMHLRPFTLRETELYLESRRFKWDRLSVMQAYMALGGIPYYLGLLHRDESFAMNIDRLFFSEELGHLPTDRLLFAVLPDICTQGRSGNGLLEQPYRDTRGKHLARFEFRAPVYDPYFTNQAGNAPRPHSDQVLLVAKQEYNSQSPN